MIGGDSLQSSQSVIIVKEMSYHQDGASLDDVFVKTAVQVKRFLPSLFNIKVVRVSLKAFSSLYLHFALDNLGAGTTTYIHTYIYTCVQLAVNCNTVILLILKIVV